LALFSDFLRYEILGAGLGLYVDCDVFCLRPIEDADYIFGREAAVFNWERPGLNNAVLKLPPDCRVLAALRAIKDARDFVPPWKKPKGRKRRWRWLSGLVRRVAIEDLPWGTVGPHAFSYYAKHYEIEHLASPIDRFYPIHWTQLELLLARDLRLSELITHRTDALHLYNNNLPRISTEVAVPEGSPLWQLVNGSVEATA
jgi:hypothetical protein